jgi:alpha-ketoglutarate-dependent 2,4-dichlorophenoxyacetate dioxygenase
MTIHVEPLTPCIGGRMTGIDARRKLTPDEVRAVDAGMDKYAVLVLPGQDITDEQQIEFTRNFGPLQNGANSTVRSSELRLDPPSPTSQPRQGRHEARARQQAAHGVAGQPALALRRRRSAPCRPKYSILSGRIVTTDGGNTEFADMRAAYDALDTRPRPRSRSWCASISLIYSRGQLGFTEFLPDERVAMKPVRHRLVRTHPGSARKSLYPVGAYRHHPRLAAARGDGLHPRPDGACHAAEFVYAHRWTQHDLVIWDNRATMHRVRRYDDLGTVRDLRRTTTRGDGPTAEQRRYTQAAGATLYATVLASGSRRVGPLASPSGRELQSARCEKASNRRVPCPSRGARNGSQLSPRRTMRRRTHRRNHLLGIASCTLPQMLHRVEAADRRRRTSHPHSPVQPEKR